jgi:MFS family permease
LRLNDHRGEGPDVSVPDAPAAANTDRSEHGPGGAIYLAFVPWILFSLITQHDTLKAAAIAALLASVLVAAPAVIAGRLRVLEIGAIVAFVGFTVLAFIADPAATHWVSRYARAIAALLLALIAFGSLLFVPFTEQYARESVPREYWSTPRFKRINRRLTLMWGSVFLAMVASHTAAGAIDTRRGNTIFNWVIPIILIVWAVKRTAAVSESG